MKTTTEEDPKWESSQIYSNGHNWMLDRIFSHIHPRSEHQALLSCFPQAPQSLSDLLPEILLFWSDSVLQL